jgi:phage N-6-adenine-methyltransferase
MTQGLLIDLPPSAPPSVESDEWYTTRETDEWARTCAGVELWHLDVAACAEAHLAPHYYTKRDDGLAKPWTGPHVWCNPPYSQISAWVEKAWIEYRAGNFTTLAMLLPAVKTEQGWWASLVEPYRDCGDRPALRTYFQRGRAAFAAPGTNGEPIKGSPFGCVLLVWRRQ